MCAFRNPDSQIVEVSTNSISINHGNWQNGGGVSHRSPSFFCCHICTTLKFRLRTQWAPLQTWNWRKLNCCKEYKFRVGKFEKDKLVGESWKYSNRASANISTGSCYQLVWPVLPPWQLSNSLMWELYEIRLDEHHSKKLLIYSWHFAIVGNRNICWCAKEAPRKSIFRCDSIS